MKYRPRILLVNPPALQLWKGMRDVTHKFQPLGLAYLAAYLQQHDLGVELFDSFAEDSSMEDIEEAISCTTSGFIGITAVSSTLREAFEIAEIAKRYGKKVIIGGPHASACAADVLRSCGYIDYAVIGEGEVTLLEILKGMDVRGIKGAAYREGKEIIVNKPRPLIEDISAIPHPARHLLNKELYHPADRAFRRNKRFSTLITSRGCPFSCDFCSAPVIWGGRVRFRNYDDIYSEIDGLHADGIEQLWIADDTFSLDEGRLKKIAGAIKHFNMEWGCNCRVDSITKEMVHYLKECNCVLIKYGVESGSQEILNAINKKITFEQVHNAVRWAKEAGIKTSCSFIIGHLNDTHDTILSTIKFACELNPDFAEFSMLTPYPGTEVFRIAQEKKLLAKECIDYKNPKYSEPVLQSFTLSPRQVKYLLRLAYVRFYLNRRAIIKILKSSFSSLEDAKRMFRLLRAGLSALRNN